MSGHTPVSPREGSESGDEGEEEEEEDKPVAMKDFDSRRSVVLIKLHCVQARYVHVDTALILRCMFVYLRCVTCFPVC